MHPGPSPPPAAPPAASPSARALRLSAVVPADDAPTTLPACLAAIRAADEPPEEVVVGDASSRSGPARARNLAALDADGDILVFVDADVEVHRDAFVRIRRAFDDDPGLAAIFGSYDDAPSAPGLVSRFRNLLHHHVHQSAGGPADTFWTGLGAIRRDAFMAAGGFDSEHHRRAMEDVELGMRLAAAGARCRLDPAIQGKHLKHWTFAGMVTTDLVHRGVPWIEALARHRTTSTALNLSWSYRTSAGLSLLGSAAVLSRRWNTGAASFAGLFGLNFRFYRLLHSRLGAAAAAPAVGLHVVHLLTAAAAVPVGLAGAGREQLGRRSTGRPSQTEHPQ